MKQGTGLCVRVAVAGGLLATLVGCSSPNRIDELRDRSRGVERFLEDQLETANITPANLRPARFEQLTGLRRQLSVANVAIGAVPLLGLSDQEKNSAYDVLDEYLGNIRWNAALPPDATPKSLNQTPQMSPILGKLNLAN
jgi:hypothetical protein